ncbi:hypothetical protein KY495_02700 [Massilia sp. PAMC28688]|uniref:glycine-rich domain-containing protein n=1 Tax=Massilia sp. PAMC28688 TaxID=2861283 RepID=UPI001C63505B|nr:hypothetical protein [Massilia sp. PAMC28688]QYF94160.1 hypothetical protein KY495_02700 [Massilia sp. PAMC28688]
MKTNNIFDAINALNLEPIKTKLMHAASGEGWSRAKADAIAIEYCRFLFLMHSYPHEQVAPTVDVDTFWHYHILDTMKYAADCEQTFGYFLHHYPYVGLDTDEQDGADARGGNRMKELYEHTFGEPYIRAEAYGTDAAQAASAYCMLQPGMKAGTDGAYCMLQPGLKAGTDAAYCMLQPSVKAGTDAAYCMLQPQAKHAGAEAAYCMLQPGVKAGTDAAYCMLQPSVKAGSDAAYCMLQPQVKQAGVKQAGTRIADCMLQPRVKAGAEAAYCMLQPQVKQGAATAYCMLQPQVQQAGTESAYCMLQPQARAPQRCAAPILPA